MLFIVGQLPLLMITLKNTNQVALIRHCIPHSDTLTRTPSLRYIQTLIMGIGFFTAFYWVTGFATASGILFIMSVPFLFVLGLSWISLFFQLATKAYEKPIY